jgi:diaminohydroxyphosphoribosylaminopyrimidine deaminase/5-amino-6-(5-phosphoribosylamino)uracil reductase
MVGAVLAQGDRILAEGWHRAYGGPHAEVECLRAYGDGAIPADAVMYVSLEPCAHTGLTPPCADLLIARGVRTVVMGCTDPDPRVAGMGIARLHEHGVTVIEHVLEAECRWMNRRFITSMEEQRPYVLLKWARSSDGFLDRHPQELRSAVRISCFATDVLVHRWRSEEQAIMVGSRTIVNDDPRLDVRHVAGRSPLRVVLDRNAVSPVGSKVFTDGGPTLLFTTDQRAGLSVEQCLIGPQTEPLEAVLRELHRRKMRSVLVEGGGELLTHFIRTGLWDEAREIVGDGLLQNGTPAPRMAIAPTRSFTSDVDRIHLYARRNTPGPAWSW